MGFLTLIILMTIVNLIQCENYTLENNYGLDRKYIQHINETSFNFTCTDKPCLLKCCALNTYVFRKKCIPKDDIDYSKINVYENIKDLNNLVKSNKTIFDLFNVVPGVFRNGYFKMFAMNMFVILSRVNFYLGEDAHLIMEIPNTYKRFTLNPNDQYCVDFVMNENKELEVQFWVLFTPNPEENKLESGFLTTAMFVSSFFLILVLVVYCLLPELRNLCGMILMAYVLSLLVSFFLLAMLRTFESKVDDVNCTRLTFTIYFSFLSTFCWMSVMSYDIWWTFRGYAKARPIHRRGEFFKFLMYCLYAFGVPGAMTIFVATVNSINLSAYPWFIQPNIPKSGCFIQGGEKLLYLYYPMMILILANWMFYLMTAFNVWRLSRGTAVLDRAAAGTPAAHRSQKNRFLVYLKLSVVMGINWLLEVVSFVYPDLSIWWLTDSYNILIGVAIFIIFVCKPKIIRKLKTRVRYLCQKGKTWQASNSTRSTSTTDSSSSQETQAVQVCFIPKGPGVTRNDF